MKLNGKTIEQCTDIIVLPRPTGDVVFKARGLLDKDYDDFRKLCPEPEPPWVTPANNKPRYQDIEDVEYRKEIITWSIKRFHWMYIKSLSVTEGLVWETVDISKPDTWKNVEIELKDNFTSGEFNRIIRLVRQVNSLDDSKIEEAKERFMLAAEKAAQV